MESAQNLLLDCERLRNFLAQNQLVQANALNQRLESGLQEAILSESNASCPAEKHKYWKPWRVTALIRSFIMSGKTDLAKKEADDLFQHILFVMAKEAEAEKAATESKKAGS